LRQAYRDLVSLFEKWQVPATFAFVMAFILAKQEFFDYADLFRDRGADGWLRQFRTDAAAQRFEGWLVPETLEIVQAPGRHEIGCHGFCHLPPAEHLADETAVRHELTAAMVIARSKGLAPKTFVYPRNLVGHTRLLQEHGFIGYRTRPPRQTGKVWRVKSALGELDPFTPTQPPRRPSPGAVTPIPSGYFLHWRFGVRRIVPAPVTVMRWRHILDHAVRHRWLAHLNFHPHNIIDAPGTLRTLDDILAVVARHRDRGDLEVMTQGGYCVHVLEGLPVPRAAVHRARPELAASLSIQF
jgi:peptidoglycan/xylan/chitin deacetylase (PgdA/CDA1 family)